MKQNCVRILIIVLCAVLAAALIGFLVLIITSGTHEITLQSQSFESEYAGPVLAAAETMQGIRLTDTDFDTGSAGSLMETLTEIGCSTVVYRGIPAGLELLLSVTAEDPPAIYAEYPLLTPEMLFDGDTAETVYDNAAAFAAEHPGLSGVILTDYCIGGCDAASLRQLYLDTGSGRSYETFLNETERNVLEQAQQGLRAGNSTLVLGAAIHPEMLNRTAVQSSLTDLLLLDAADDNAARIWAAACAPDKPICGMYPSPMSFRQLERRHQANGFSGYLLSGLPTEQEQPAVKPQSTQEAEPSESIEQAPTPPVIHISTSESQEASPDEPDISTETELSGGDSEASESSESSKDETVTGDDPLPPEVSPDPLAEAAHEHTLKLLAGLTDPADMTPLYLPSDLLSDKLILNRPLSKASSGSASALLFSGVVPLGSTVTLDGDPVELDEFGHFHYDVPLYAGANVIYLRVDDQTYTFTYQRNLLDVTNYSPIYNASVPGGRTVPVWITARNGAQVTASLGDQTIALTQQNNYAFATFNGEIPLPEGAAEAQSLGQVVFRVQYNGKTQVVRGGSITVLPGEMADQTTVMVQAQDSKFKDNGSALVFPITPWGAHAPDQPDFDAADNANWNFSPVPNGTVDVVVNEAVYMGKEYYELRSGVRIAKEDVVPFDGVLTSNTIRSLTVANDGEYTRLRFDMTSPVLFQVNAGSEAVTVTFADTVNVPEDLELTKNPIFSAAHWDGSILTLPLRIKDGFLGYTSYYEGTQLTLVCTNPPISGSVEGARIVLDPGHGGFGTESRDVGAVGAGMLDEAQLNWYIANDLQVYLTQLGADPILTNAWEELLTIEQRMSVTAAHRASMHISIHHNAATTGDAYGVGTYYFWDNSQPLSQLVQREVAAVHDRFIPEEESHDNGLYHTRYLFTLRTGWVSLMLEDGFVCHGDTYTQLVQPQFRAEVAKALATAIAVYYERFAPVANWQTGVESTLSA